MNMAALWVTSQVLPGLIFEDGLKTLAVASAGLMILNIAIIPLLKVMFLPLNLLTLGLFTWVINVVGLYLLTTAIPALILAPVSFSGANFGLVIIPPLEMNILQVAIAASFLVGLTSHFFQWLVK